ncbi:MobF family relaxase, partial [Asaia bogorensis]
TSAPPTDAALARLYEAKRADTGEAWSGQGKKRDLSAWDFTASPDKSVSLAAELCGTALERAAIWHAIHQAGEETMHMIMDHVGVARRGDGKTAHAEEGETAYVFYRHHTARPTLEIQDGPDGATAVIEVPVAGDPQSHIHYHLFNAVATQSGHLGSLDSARITKTTSFLFGAYFQAILAERLRELGIEVQVDETHRAIRVTAVPDQARDFFSKRHKDTQKRAEDFVASQGREWQKLSAEEKFRILSQTNQIFRQAKWTGGNEQEIWAEMAKELGWETSSVMTGHKAQSLSDEERYDAAYQVAIKLVADDFKSAAVLDAELLRVHAARGLIGVGIKGEQDIERVAELIKKRGIVFNGVQTQIVERSQHNTMRIANREQIRIEKSVSQHIERMLEDKTGRLDPEVLRRAIAASGLDFTSEPEHGAAQLAAIHALGEADRIAFLMGVAGAGKTALLKPLVSAWKEEGRQVVGTGIAWRQAEALRDAGIDRTYALTRLLSEFKSGKLVLDDKSVLVIDEMSQIAPKPFLELLEHQKKMGFSMRMLGDRDQGQAIEAGDSIELLLRALPPSHLPQITSTLRQKFQRDRAIAALFRSDGRDLSKTEAQQREADVVRAGEALDMKRADGTVRLVGGSHRKVVEDIARLYLRRRDMLLAAGYTRGVTISAPTNADVADISQAIRAHLKARGEIGEDRAVVRAIDQRGEQYDLPLTIDDRVRLFDRIECRVKTPHGVRRHSLGSNGDFVTVRDVQENGLVLRNRQGREGFVSWDDLRDVKHTDRIRLGFGHAMTIDAAQGITSDEHINAMPRGTASMTGFMAYVAETRHVYRCWTMISEAAVREAELRSRALGDPDPVRMADLWNRVAGDLGRHDYKALGLDLVMGQQELDRLRAKALAAAINSERVQMAGRIPAAELQTKRENSALEATAPGDWKDLTYLLKQTGFELSRAMQAEARREQVAEQARKRQERERVRERAPSQAPGM